MTSVHVLVVTWLSLLSEPVGLQTPLHTVIASCTPDGEYLPLLLVHILHIVYTGKVYEHQSVHDGNFAFMVAFRVFVSIPDSSACVRRRTMKPHNSTYMTYAPMYVMVFLEPTDYFSIDCSLDMYSFRTYSLTSFSSIVSHSKVPRYF